MKLCPRYFILFHSPRSPINLRFHLKRAARRWLSIEMRVGVDLEWRGRRGREVGGVGKGSKDDKDEMVIGTW